MATIGRAHPGVRPATRRTVGLLLTLGLALSGCAVRGADSGTAPGPDASAISTSSSSGSSGSAVSVSPSASMPSPESADGPTSPAGLMPTSAGVADESVSVAAQTRPTASQVSRRPTTAPSSSVVDGAPRLEQLNGRTFALTGTFTDAGGADLMTPGLDFRITFAGSTATVAGDCTLRYPTLRVVGGAPMSKIDFGNAVGDPQCVVGSDPAGPPVGKLFVGFEGATLHLNTGAVGWNFREVG